MAKDMILLLLYGLEMFLGVCVGCPATPAIFKWPGDAIYICLQVVEPLLQQSAKIYVPSDEPMPLPGVASVHPVTLRPEVAVELLLLTSLHWYLAPMHHRFNRC